MKLKLTKSLIALLLVSASSLALAASIAEFAPEKEMEGTIQAVDFGANTLIFEGVRFQVLPDAEVEMGVVNKKLWEKVERLQEVEQIGRAHV